MLFEKMEVSIRLFWSSILQHQNKMKQQVMKIKFFKTFIPLFPVHSVTQIHTAS